MSARHLAWVPAAATAGLAIAAMAFSWSDDGTALPADQGTRVSFGSDVVFGLMYMTFAALGALLVTRRPRNPISWILCGSPLALGISALVTGWYRHALYAEPGSALPPEPLLWLGSWIWIPGFVPLITALLLLFPDGRLPSRRWRPAAALVAGSTGLLLVGYAFDPGALTDFSRTENPLGATGALAGVAQFCQELGLPLVGVAAIASAAALISRFRSSQGLQRQQLSWMAAAAASVVLAFFANGLLDELLGVDVSILLPLVLLTIPAATTVALLRYRLYDLGLVLNRTLVYLALSVTLGATYLGLVLLAGLAVGGSDVAVAISTLAVAGLFRPLRSRIQALVDRRFYRHRYDAARTLEAFSGRLRDEVDLDALREELSGVVTHTVQPTHVTLWLRP